MTPLRDQPLPCEGPCLDLLREGVARLGHKLRTPLGVILGTVDVLRGYHGQLSPEERDECLASIREATLRITALITDEQVLALLGVP